MERIKKMLAIGMGVLIVSAMISNAHETYTGYSGAPGSEGACTPCHGTTGGHITATGFPSAYSPGAAYTIKITHSSTGIIVNFNASCRVGASSQNAGTIAAGTNTAVYNVATYETNGVHFGTSMVDSGNFKWTAPAKGTGMVKLYVAGLQTSSSGAKTALVLTATESGTSVIADKSVMPRNVCFHIIGPNKMAFALPAGFAPEGISMMEIFNLQGRVADVRMTQGATVSWDGIDRAGKQLSAGTYFFLLRQNDHVAGGRIILTR